nr:inorganic diphosphatase [Streptomyces sp. NBC_00830]
MRARRTRRSSRFRWAASTPTTPTINTLDDLPKVEQQRIEQFFAVYKNLPADREAVELIGFGSAKTAREQVKESVTACRSNCS